jgi:flagellar hook-associated protein 1 FlgK
MSGLLGSLSSAARALEAQRFGLEVTGQNIANVNTAGYTRREAHFAAVPGTTPLSPGNGVEIIGARATRDIRLDLRLQQERPAEQREAALAEALRVVETAIGLPGSSIDASLGQFFDAMGRLASDPTSAIARQEVLSQADDLAGDFRDMSGRLDLARRDADAGVRAGVDEINVLVERIASLNNSLSKVPPDGSQSLQLRDELGLAVKDLSGLIDIDTIARPDGGLDVSFGNGRPLVIGAYEYKIEVSSSGPLGLATISAQGFPVTSEITGGRIGGLLHARDTAIPGYMAQLDTLAYSVATEVNALHRAGYDLSGVTGRDLFAPPTAVAGAARNLAVDAAVAGQPSRLAASASTSSGDNSNARAMAALRDARVMSGGTATMTDAWGQLVYQVGADSKSAQSEGRSRGEIVRQIELLREQVSGVSLDEEAMLMMKFQRAYEANARYFQAVDRALDTLIQALGR